MTSEDKILEEFTEMLSNDNVKNRDVLRKAIQKSREATLKEIDNFIIEQSIYHMNYKKGNSTKKHEMIRKSILRDFIKQLKEKTQ